LKNIKISIAHNFETVRLKKFQLSWAQKPEIFPLYNFVNFDEGQMINPNFARSLDMEWPTYFYNEILSFNPLLSASQPMPITAHFFTRACFTCSSVHTSSLHPLLAHHDMCYTDVHLIVYLTQYSCFDNIVFTSFCHSHWLNRIFCLQVWSNFTCSFSRCFYCTDHHHCCLPLAPVSLLCSCCLPNSCYFCKTHSLSCAVLPSALVKYLVNRIAYDESAVVQRGVMFHMAWNLGGEKEKKFVWLCYIWYNFFRLFVIIFYF